MKRIDASISANVGPTRFHLDFTIWQSSKGSVVAYTPQDALSQRVLESDFAKVDEIVSKQYGLTEPLSFARDRDDYFTPIGSHQDESKVKAVYQFAMEDYACKHLRNLPEPEQPKHHQPSIEVDR